MRKGIRKATMVAGLMWSTGAMAQSLPPERLPDPVQDRVRAWFPEARLEGAWQNGPYYEASVLDRQIRYDLVFDRRGNVLEQHESLSTAEIPAMVRAGIRESFPRHAVWKATRVTSPDGAFYDLLLTRRDRTVSVRVDEEGRRLQV